MVLRSIKLANFIFLLIKSKNNLPIIINQNKSKLKTELSSEYSLIIKTK